MTLPQKTIVVRWAFSVCVGLVALAVSQAQPVVRTVPATLQQKYALVIGISGYASLGGKDAELKYAGRDATDFAAFIKTVQGGSFPPDNVHLVTNRDATRDRIFSEFRWLYNTAGPNDLVYVFFAGHGVDYNDDSYLLPINATRDNLDSEGIPMSQFFRKVTRELSAKQIVVIIDACGAAAAVRGARAPAGVDVQKEWDRLNAKEGQLAMAFFSSLAYQKSWEDPELGGGHGLFTWYLLEGLEGAAGRTPEGWITAASLLDYVKEKVEARSQAKFQSRQTPVSSPDFRTDFKLAFSKTPPPAPSAPVEAPSFGVVQISSVNRGVIYIDGKEMGQIFENGRKTFQKQTVGKHQVQIKGADLESIDLVVENGTIAYANFGITIPIDKTGTTATGALHIRAEPGLSGEVYIDNYRVGHLEEGGEISIVQLIAGKHNYAIIGPNQVTTEGPVDITANVTRSLTVAPPTNLKAVVH